MRVCALVLFALVGLLLTACASDERPIPANAPPPYAAGTYRQGRPPRSTQPPPADPRRPVARDAPRNVMGPTPPPADGPAPVLPTSYAGQELPMWSVMLELRGMTCPVKCVRQIREMLGGAPGVQSVAVNYDLKTALCRFTKGTKIDGLPAYVRPPYSAHVVAANQ